MSQNISITITNSTFGDGVQIGNQGPVVQDAGDSDTPKENQ